MIRILHGDCRDVLRTLPDASVHMVCTSPPYFGLRSYLADGHADKASEIGSERSPDEYIAALVAVFREVWRVLRNDGICFINLGDSYSSNPATGRKSVGESYRGSDTPTLNSEHQCRTSYRGQGIKPKDLLMIPARVAIALQADGWFIRSQMPWVKRGCMPESANDRPGSAVEYVYLLTKRPHYFWDAEAVKRQGTIKAGTRAAKGGNVRSQIKEVNGRPPEYWDYTGERNFRNGDLFFESIDTPHGAVLDGQGDIIALDVNTAPLSDAHFATFPPKLITPLILAGTSERGCCPACGAPWTRLLEKRLVKTAKGCNTGVIDARDRAADKNDQGSNRQKDGHLPGWARADITLGWAPTCSCPSAEPQPCTVLDPFSGAGTTCLVADRLQRHAIGIDLNDTYRTMARERLVKDAGMFAELSA